MVLFRVRRNSWFWVTAAAGAVAVHMVICWLAAVARWYHQTHRVFERVNEKPALGWRGKTGRIAKLTRKPDHSERLLEKER